jgi:hypothetical protein
MRKRSRSPEKQDRRPPAVVVTPPLPAGYRCHVCEGLHWTVACPRVLREPAKYRSIHLYGCNHCGQKGHVPAKCTVKKLKCVECGAMHDTRECPYSYTPVEWHEFLDDARQRLFYVRADDAAQRGVWATPTRLDVVLWHCGRCRLLMPEVIGECVGCHAARPRNGMRPAVMPQHETVAVNEGNGDQDERENSAPSVSVSTQVLEE